MSTCVISVKAREIWIPAEYVMQGKWLLSSSNVYGTMVGTWTVALGKSWYLPDKSVESTDSQKGRWGGKEAKATPQGWKRVGQAKLQGAMRAQGLKGE